MAQTESLAPLSVLDKAPYSHMVAYPRGEPDEVRARIDQLGKLGVSDLDFQGGLKSGHLSVLGKGVGGIVVAGVGNGRRIALQMRRVDARAQRMTHEGEHCEPAHSLGLGPRHLRCH